MIHIASVAGPAKFKIQLMRNWIMKRVSCSKSLLTSADDVFFLFSSVLTDELHHLLACCFKWKMKEETSTIWLPKLPALHVEPITRVSLLQLKFFVHSRFVVCDVQVNHAEHTNAESLRTSILNVYTMILSLLCNYFIEIIFASHRLRLCAPSFNNIIHWRLCAGIA